MKKIIIFTTTLFLFFSTVSFAQWESPWEPDPEVNLYTLLSSGFKVASTNLVKMGVTQGLVEVIYLQKKEIVYRCLTIRMGSSRESEHECAIIIKPEKTEQCEINW